MENTAVESFIDLEDSDVLIRKNGLLATIVYQILKCGEIPRHIGFIMDGNRRFANRAHIKRCEGHKKGFETLSKVLSWCRALGVQQVTLYAFSLENFKRTADEVDSIMQLASDKCDNLLDEMDRVNEAGIRIRITGDLERLPKDLQAKISKIHSMTEQNNKAFLNICMAYTSRRELVASLQSIASKVKEGTINPNEINLSTIENELYLTRPYPDMIIRTSGEVRLSDFMLWQCQYSLLLFIKPLWPELTIWDFYKAIFHYQYTKKFCKTFKNS